MDKNDVLLLALPSHLWRLLKTSVKARMHFFDIKAIRMRLENSDTNWQILEISWHGICRTASHKLIGFMINSCCYFVPEGSEQSDCLRANSLQIFYLLFYIIRMLCVRIKQNFVFRITIIQILSSIQPAASLSHCMTQWDVNSQNLCHLLWNLLHNSYELLP